MTSKYYSERLQVEVFEVQVLPEDLMDKSNIGYSFNPVFNVFSRLTVDQFPDKDGIMGGHDNVYEVFFKDKEHAPKRFSAHVRTRIGFGNVFYMWDFLAKSEKSDLMDYVDRGEVTVYFVTHIDIDKIIAGSME